MEEASNMEAHRTNYYNSRALTVRRGQEFSLSLNFNRPYQKKDKLEFIAATGQNPQKSDNTMAIFQLSSSKNGSSWNAILQSISSTDMNVTIISPADAVIGHYQLKLYISSNKMKAQFKLNNIILLFNPWIPDDVVYMEDENERQEYVLNDSGIIYKGLEHHISELGWDFGQFEESILEICLQILDKSLNHQNDPALDCSQRNDPAYIGRVVSAMVNSINDEGVVEGSWSGSLRGGVDPKAWSGSVEILKRWHSGGCKPVKYGQCWVFAGVMCTVLRCLGIPTRVVTNFDSAHDTDGNLSVDTVYSVSGRNESKDSMWSYHVWDESWFHRIDLGTDYSGWQVLDATPQELSNGMYRCGPTSVHAVKEGDVDLNYDGPFVFAEVNADRNTWVYYSKDVKERVYTDVKSVGKHISTKGVGNNSRVDITDSYKYPEGSEEERKVYLKARKKLLEMGILKEDQTEKPTKLDIRGKFELETSPKLGEDINLILVLKNTGKKRESLKMNLSSSSLEYTGRPKAEIFTDKTSLSIDPMEEKHFPIHIPASQYERQLTTDNLIEVVALCELENKKKMLVRIAITVERPPIEIKVHNSPVVNEPFEIEVTFTNPLSDWLNDGVLILAGSGLIKDQITKKVLKLEPRRTRRIFLEITPYRSGTKQLVVDLTSKHFSAIKGFQSIEVSDISKEETEDE
ncbi:protein-glutamine gamma-glutamyltransferase 6-like [Rhinophrynus dorsalis]